MSPRYGELWPTNGWDQFGSLGHSSKFQRVSRLGSVTARQSSSERQPNFTALTRGRHLCLAGWPPRWALAHILVPFAILLRAVVSIVPMLTIMNVVWVGLNDDFGNHCSLKSCSSRLCERCLPFVSPVALCWHRNAYSIWAKSGASDYKLKAKHHSAQTRTD